MFKYVQSRNTRANCEICSRFIRTSLEHIRISQLVLGIHLELWISIFKQGYSLTSYKFTFFSFAEIVQLEIYVGSIKYPANIYLLKLNRHARTSCGMYSALVIRHQKVGLMKVSIFMILGFKLPFSVFFSLSNCWKGSIFNSVRNTRLFDALEDWPIVLPISVKIGKCRAIKFDLEVELLEV